MEKEIIDRIKMIIADCESVQESCESRYTKECAKISSYEQIAELLGKEDKDGK